MNKIDTDIDSNLTRLEKQAFNIINDVRMKRSPSTVIRVCGGWVRDKLMGKDSDDIDLMTDNISGSAFAKILVEELKLEKDPHIIKENPEKTKNIEAAKVHVPIGSEQVELDFVQSRKEEYGENRREVVVKPATAQEDAMRRDLTINALFYNINENKIEDFTGKGIVDLITNTIRTPYDDGDSSSVDEVKKTFIEDPLRVFRTIRFAAKLNGNISDSTLKAMQDPEVINAIFYSERKIATERIGQEFKKILKNPNAEIGVKILKETGLFQHILNESIKGTEFENQLKPLDMDQNNAHHQMTVWDHTYHVLMNLLKNFNYEDEKRIVMILSALTHDLGKLYVKIHGESKSHPGTTSYHGHEEASQKLSELILKYLKFENDFIKQVSGLARYHMQPHALERDNSSVNALRKFIRRMGEQSINWIDVINLATADAYSKGTDIDPKTIESYENLRNRLEEALASMNIVENKVKPVLNGHQIMSILNIPPSPQIAEVQEYLKNIMDDQPNLNENQAVEILNTIKLRAEEISEKSSIDYQQAISQSLKNDKQITASTIRTSNTCSQQLFKKKYKDICDLIKRDKHVEALSNIKLLLKEYKDDPRVLRMVAIFLFKIFSSDPSLRDNDLLQIVFDKTEDNVFDPVLSCHAIGLLILFKTATKEKVILSMCNDMEKIYPGILKNVIESIPSDKAHNKNLLQKIKRNKNE